MFASGVVFSDLCVMIFVRNSQGQENVDSSGIQSCESGGGQRQKVEIGNRDQSRTRETRVAIRRGTRQPTRQTGHVHAWERWRGAHHQQTERKAGCEEGDGMVHPLQTRESWMGRERALDGEPLWGMGRHRWASNWLSNQAACAEAIPANATS